MKYISIDIETGGLDETKHDILQFAAIADDLSQNNIGPIFNAYITKPEYCITPYCMQLHTTNGLLNELMNKPDDYKYFENINAAIEAFMFWLEESVAPYWEMKQIRGVDGYKFNIAGKNVKGFDLKFLETQSHIWKANIKPHQRTIDPAILYYEKGDVVLPDLSTCLKRAGLSKTIVTHNAVDDAMDVINLIRTKLK